MCNFNFSFELHQRNATRKTQIFRTNDLPTNKRSKLIVCDPPSAIFCLHGMRHGINAVATEQRQSTIHKSATEMRHLTSKADHSKKSILINNY